MSSEVVVWISCGGTGGHFVPGTVLGESLKVRGAQVSYWGEGKAIETVLAESHQVELRRPEAGTSRWKRFRQIWSMMKKARRQEKPSCCLLFGGFSSFILGAFALRYGIPFYIFEQNAIAGRINRLFARFSKCVFLAFPLAIKNVTAKRVKRTGNPVRSNAEEKEPIYDVLILGGSQGAKAINEQLPAQLQKHWKICHVAGPGKKEAAEQAYQKAGFEEAHVLEHDPDIPGLISRSRWVISRAGATSLAEIAASGKALITIPFPYAKDDHQRANAKVLVQMSAAEVLEEHDLKDSSENLKAWIDDTMKTTRMGEQIQRSEIADLDGQRALEVLLEDGLIKLPRDAALSHS